MENPENSIEWITGQHTITCTISQKRYIRKIEELAQKYPKTVRSTVPQQSFMPTL